MSACQSGSWTKFQPPSNSGAVYRPKSVILCFRHLMRLLLVQLTEQNDSMMPICKRLSVLCNLCVENFE